MVDSVKKRLVWTNGVNWAVLLDCMQVCYGSGELLVVHMNFGLSEFMNSAVQIQRIAG